MNADAIATVTLKIDAEVHRQLPGTEAQLLLIANETHPDPAHAELQAARLLERARAAHPDPDALAGGQTDTAYRHFYRAMGLKAAQVSTPVKQARRVLERGAYRPISKTVDVAMEIEYATLVSFQAYDAAAAGGELEYRLAEGGEPITTMGGDYKCCKRGELILLGAGGVLHSSYYGNASRARLTDDAEHALLRILRIPGLDGERFRAAVEEAGARLRVLAAARA